MCLSVPISSRRYSARTTTPACKPALKFTGQPPPFFTTPSLFPRRPAAGQELLAVAGSGRGHRPQHHGGVLAVPPPHVRGARVFLPWAGIHNRLLHSHRPRLPAGLRFGEFLYRRFAPGLRVSCAWPLGGGACSFVLSLGHQPVFNLRKQYSIQASTHIAEFSVLSYRRPSRMFAVFPTFFPQNTNYF